jgi:hypothetical protein
MPKPIVKKSKNWTNRREKMVVSRPLMSTGRNATNIAIISVKSASRARFGVCRRWLVMRGMIQTEVL